MIDIESLAIRNFLSYGDYDTVIKLDDLKSCLITGTILNEGDDPDRNNGSGKSSLINAIVWCLFGRTTHGSNPGDKVLNFITKTNCRVQLKFKNGDTLTRTRKGTDGHNELIYHRSGEDVSLGTNNMQQAELNRLLELDYTLFCGSAFFSQYDKPWMEMSDPKRRQALEREFHLDRLQLRAAYAKEQKEAAESQQELIRVKVTTNQHTITTLQGEIVELDKASAGFDVDKEQRLCDANAQLAILEAELDQIKPPDLRSLEAKWSMINKALELLKRKRTTVEGLEATKRRITQDIAQQQATIKKWAGRVGKQCGECERPYDQDYIGSKTSTPQDILCKMQAELTETTSALQEEQRKLTQATDQIQSKQPSQTVQEAQREHKEWARRAKAVQNQQVTIAGIQATTNKFGESIDRLQKRITDIQGDIDSSIAGLKEHDRVILHWNYIYKVYSDRRKIKGRILCEFIPYLNERIGHYLDKFQMRLRVEFTDALGIRANYWGYEFFSGGERKRVDVAIMLAMFDLHNLMYSHQCNILVLDEVDGRLDKLGANLFADIVREDIAPEVDSVLIISHRLEMRGAFESEIKIQKDSPLPEGQSRVLEIIR